MIDTVNELKHSFHREKKTMAKANTTLLDVDNPFPKLELQLLSGETLNLSEGFGDGLMSSHYLQLSTHNLA